MKDDGFEIATAFAAPLTTARWPKIRPGTSALRRSQPMCRYTRGTRLPWVSGVEQAISSMPKSSTSAHVPCAVVPEHAPSAAASRPGSILPSLSMGMAQSVAAPVPAMTAQAVAASAGSANRPRADLPKFTTEAISRPCR